jgi:3-deoxy-D-manno-octulosonic-acid transferase
MSLLAYNIFLHTVAAPVLAAYYLPRIVLRGKYRRSLAGKLGRLPADLVLNRLSRPRIWFHAVSVGEVVALMPLVRQLKRRIPHASIIISTGTETGQDRARDSIRDADGFLYLPIDFPECVNRVVDAVRPDLFVLMETELWPNLLHRLKQVGAAVALANGRISDRSFPRYRKLKRFFSPILGSIDLLLMGSELDAQRIREIGAPADRVRITGNTKFDAALGVITPDVESEIRRALDLEPSAQVFVAGSTHPGEHEVILDAYAQLTKQFPDLILIVVPRHVERTPAILAAMDDRGMEPPFLWSSLHKRESRGGKKVIVIDCTGELFRIYSVASVVFVGGSLAPKGGQNILEPAAWGKPVLFGPSMEDFREARDLLTSMGSGIQIYGARDVESTVKEILSAPEEWRARGDRGRSEIVKHVGSADKNAELLAHLLAST